MRVLADEEDEEFRERVREGIGFHHEPSQGREPVEMKDKFTVPYSHSKYDENFRKTLDIIKQKEESLYILAFEEGQYVPTAAGFFEQKMNGNAVEVSHSEIDKVVNELIVVYVLPGDMYWIILIDHDGNIHFSGDIRDESKQIFSEQQK